MVIQAHQIELQLQLNPTQLQLEQVEQDNQVVYPIMEMVQVEQFQHFQLLHQPVVDLEQDKVGDQHLLHQEQVDLEVQAVVEDIVVLVEQEILHLQVQLKDKMVVVLLVLEEEEPAVAAVLLKSEYPEVQELKVEEA